MLSALSLLACLLVSPLSALGTGLSTAGDGWVDVRAIRFLDSEVSVDCSDLQEVQNLSPQLSKTEGNGPECSVTSPLHLKLDSLGLQARREGEIYQFRSRKNAEMDFALLVRDIEAIQTPESQRLERAERLRLIGVGVGSALMVAGLVYVFLAVSSSGFLFPQ